MPNYLRILRRGSHNVRVLLENGETQLVPRSELESWTYVGSGTPNLYFNSTSRGSREPFVNPTNQEDRIYTRITRRGTRNTCVCLQNGETLSIPNEYLSTWLRRGTIEYYAWDDSTNYPNGRGLVHLTFGIELEFIADVTKYESFCDAMRDALGVNRFSSPMTYGNSSKTKWVLGYDRSVRSTSERDRGKSGYELTSPILKFDQDSKDELTKVLHLITTVFNGKVNITCGTHIHIGNFVSENVVRSVAVFNRVQQFQANYGKFEATVFDRLVAPSRRGDQNHYCKSCNRPLCDDRYHKINAKSLSEFGTIENRQHAGTLEVDKIWAWMELNGRYIVSFFKNPSDFTDTTLTLVEFLDKINISPDTKCFFVNRYQHFLNHT
jgi:hypothetical protein